MAELVADDAVHGRERRVGRAELEQHLEELRQDDDPAVLAEDAVRPRELRVLDVLGRRAREVGPRGVVEG